MIKGKMLVEWHKDMIDISESAKSQTKLMTTAINEQEKSRCGFSQRLKNRNYRY